MSVQQNEVGGKSLLLKVGRSKTFTTDGTTAAITMTAHSLVVGDVLIFPTGSLGAITNLDVNVPYYVKTITDANTIQISESPTDAALVPDAAVVAQTCAAFVSVGGIRSKSISFSSEGIDITSHDSDEWQKFLDAAGARALAISGSGVYTNQGNFVYVEEQAYANNLMELMFIDVSTFKCTWSYFKVTAVEQAGDYNAEGTFSITANSAAEVFRYKVGA